MLLTISGLLTRAQLAKVEELLARASFVDGKLSAGAAARRVKQNEELSVEAPELRALNDIVMTSLIAHPAYRFGALPHRVAAPYYARYTEGMSYGEHVDDPIMGPGPRYRSDVAVTIFLSAADAYDGGELVIRTPYGEQAVKLPAGDAVLYPASTRHRVAPVTRGVRLVAVTWVQSLVKEPERRELLYELYLAREHMLKEAPQGDATARIDRVYVNLVRMWSEV